MSQYDPKFALKINVGYSDQYFKVQYFCLISWKVFDYIYIRYIMYYESAVLPEVWPQIKCRSLWPTFHGPVILAYILKSNGRINIMLMDYNIVWPDVGPQNKCRSQWPTIYSPVILPYTLKSIGYI